MRPLRLLLVLVGLLLVVMGQHQYSARLRHNPPALMLYTQIEPAKNDETLIVMSDLRAQNPSRTLPPNSIYRAQFLPDGAALIGLAPHNNASDICRYGLADQHLTWLTDGTDFENNVTLSPTGRQIAYSVWITERMETALLHYQKLYIRDLHGAEHRHIPLERDQYYIGHAWRDANTVLLSTTANTTPRNTLWLVDVNSGDRRAILQSDVVRYQFLATSPDQQTVAIITADEAVAIEVSPHHLQLLGPDGTLSNPLPLGDVVDLQDVVWSSDGAWIYFAGGLGYPALQDLYRIRPDGSDLEQLTASPTLAEVAPSISPPIDGPIHALAVAAAGMALIMGSAGLARFLRVGIVNRHSFGKKGGAGT